MSFFILAQITCAGCSTTKDPDLKSKKRRDIFENTDEADTEAFGWFQRGAISAEEYACIYALVIEAREACAGCNGYEMRVNQLIKNDESLQDILGGMKQVKVRIDRQNANRTAKKSSKKEGNLLFVPFGKKSPSPKRGGGQDGNPK